MRALLVACLALVAAACSPGQQATTTDQGAAATSAQPATTMDSVATDAAQTTDTTPHTADENFNDTQ